MLHTLFKLSLVAILSFATSNFIQNQDTVTLRLEFETTKSSEGQIALALFDNAEDFLERPIKSDAKEVIDNKVTFEFNAIPKGSYSFSFYHDVNANGELDTNFMGVPKEPYGFSNNQKGRFGPPNYEDAKITIDKNTTLKLTIK